MTTLSNLQIETAIKEYIDPFLGTDLVSAKVLKSIDIDGGNISILIVFGFPCSGHHKVIKDNVGEVISRIEGVNQVKIEISTEILSHAVQRGITPFKNIKNMIAVASGKGGVGKSTTSVNLALALSLEGAKVGILDADIYGPSQPMMLGASAKPQTTDGKTMEPVSRHGLESMSIGYLVDEDTPMIWRGPMVTTALEQLLRDTNWGELDYLVIDLPPGTGDTQLTLAQKIPVSGVVIVTTPQDISLIDAKKALKMFEKVEVPVLGIIENMSTHVCSECGHEEAIFGRGGGESMADQYDINLLGALPLDRSIRENADGGNPTVVADPEGKNAMKYREIARKLSAQLALKAKDYSAKFPNIVIQNT